jgi:hypothetical protein
VPCKSQPTNKTLDFVGPGLPRAGNPRTARFTLSTNEPLIPDCKRMSYHEFPGTCTTHEIEPCAISQLAPLIKTLNFVGPGRRAVKSCMVPQYPGGKNMPERR